MQNVTYSIERKDQGPWHVTFTCGDCTYSTVATGSHAQATHFAQFVAEGAVTAVTQAVQRALQTHVERRFGDWVRAQWMGEET